MRTFEWLIVGVLLPAIFALLQPQWPAWTGWLAVAAAILVLLHAVLEGMHWQMGPAYLATGLLLLVESEPSIHPLPRLSAGVLGGLLLAASLACSWALPMFRLPKPAGQYPVGTRLLYFTDPDRKEMHAWAHPGNREVVVQLWYPAATSKGPRAMYRRRTETRLRSSYQVVLRTDCLQDMPLAPGRFPLILYNPAWHGARQRGSFISQELASHGFVVAAISHPYNSTFVELSDGRTANPDYGQDIGFSAKQFIPLHKRFELAEEELVIQTQDCRLVLDELEKLDRTPGHPLESHLATDCVGSYGHSFGGAVSAEFARQDPRVHAALELDGVLHGAAATLGLDKPLMLIDSSWILDPSEGQDGWEGPIDDPKIRWRDVANEESKKMWKIIADTKTDVLRRTGGIRLIFEGTGHADFTDQIFMSPLRKLSQAGSVPPKRVAEILNAYVLAFFRQTLLGVPSPLLSRDVRPFPEVKLEISDA